MPTQDSATALLTQFSQALGLDGMTFDEDGIVNLRTAEDLLVSLGHEVESGSLLVCSKVHDDAGTLDTALLRRLLVSNVKLQAESGPTFAVVPDTGAVVLQQRLALEGLEYKEFESVWTAFVDCVELAREKLVEAGAEGGGGGVDQGFSLNEHLTLLRP